MLTISVVIPTLNEAGGLAETVRRAQRITEISEIIVVDGGSRDATVQLAEELGCRTLQSQRSRGRQMRAGAAAAAGQVILFLHADTWLPPEAGRAIVEVLADPAVVAGGFWKVFRERFLLMLGSRMRCGLRLAFRQRILGDQALFVRRDALEAIGGVPDMPLMEDFELCRRLRAQGKLVLARATVTTSARRFAKHGILRTYWLMGRVTLQYYLGTPVERLVQIYERE